MIITVITIDPFICYFLQSRSTHPFTGQPWSDGDGDPQTDTHGAVTTSQGPHGAAIMPPYSRRGGALLPNEASNDCQMRSKSAPPNGVGHW
nr:hypothetical protein Iba_chr04fCG10740 [Ipomoea batatas]